MEADPKLPENSPETTPKPKAKHGGARRGAGRSKLPVEAIRNKVVGVCCTAAEHAFIQRAAEDRGLTMSDYCRLRALGQKLPPIIPTLEA